jgi:hypothetical protein
MEDSETGQRKTSLEKVSLNLNRCNNSLYFVVDPDSGFRNLDLYPVPDQVLLLHFCVLIYGVKRLFRSS